MIYVKCWLHQTQLIWHRSRNINYACKIKLAGKITQLCNSCLSCKMLFSPLYNEKTFSRLWFKNGAALKTLSDIVRRSGVWINPLTRLKTCVKTAKKKETKKQRADLPSQFAVVNFILIKLKTWFSVFFVLGCESHSCLIPFCGSRMWSLIYV